MEGKKVNTKWLTLKGHSNSSFPKLTLQSLQGYSKQTETEDRRCRNVTWCCSVREESQSCHMHYLDPLSQRASPQPAPMLTLTWPTQVALTHSALSHPTGVILYLQSLILRYISDTGKMLAGKTDTL